ncbi:hypothetical protein [Rubritalea tangerina]|uniref:FecR protein domain-containing protein n=1 Tax=Rubritalea tangerina TaxID=430798 RepID=A0ABW4ZEX7_9BACT
MNAKQRTQLQHLVDLILTDTPLSSQQTQQLDHLLQDPEARSHYLNLVELDSHLPSALEQADILDLLEEPKPPLSLWLPISAAAIAILTFILGFKIGQHPTPTLATTPPPSVDSHSPAPNASITSILGVRWAQPADSLHNIRKIVFESGLIELTHQSGVQVTIEGPASYQVTGPNAGKLDYGKCVANVPRGAEGYTVDYSMGKVVDLGTEFGMELTQNGELSVGVFKGLVELHPEGSQTVSTITQDHALRQHISNPTQIDSIPFERSKFIRHVPSREFSWHITSHTPVTKTFDISHLVWKPGDFRTVIKWMQGQDAIKITSASIWRDGVLISQDNHLATVGTLNRTSNNIYNFSIPEDQYQRGYWQLKIDFSPLDKSNSSISTEGILLLEEGLAFNASKNDFIGTWRYDHNGSSWERTLHPDGSIELFENGRLKPGFKKSHWIVEDGVMKVWIPHRNAFEDHILRDPNTLIFVNEPYRNAHKVP